MKQKTKKKMLLVIIIISLFFLIRSEFEINENEMNFEIYHPRSSSRMYIEYIPNPNAGEPLIEESTEINVIMDGSG